MHGCHALRAPLSNRDLAGSHYPRSVGEFQAWFRTEADCLDYLEWLRWPVGFACPVCGHERVWRLGDGRLMCGGCGGRPSVTAGTIFERTRTPLTVWFAACWLFASTRRAGSQIRHPGRRAEPLARAPGGPAGSERRTGRGHGRPSLGQQHPRPLGPGLAGRAGGWSGVAPRCPGSVRAPPPGRRHPHRRRRGRAERLRVQPQGRYPQR
jgi:predicted RNA-binding Zn-ribbon protein involved in translation (DUF1610 family)